MNPISLVLLAGIGFFLLLWLRTMPPKKRTRTIILIALVSVALFTLLLAITGRLHWIAAVVAALLPFMQKVIPVLFKAFPFLGRWYLRRQQAKYFHRNQANMSTAILEMHIDQDTGTVYGKVKRGPLKDRELNELSEEEFIQLLLFCRKMEKDSATLLENYLDKRFGNAWRKDDPEQAANAPHTHSQMSQQEAYELLGLQPGCSKEDIIAEHRRLMQKLHPDRGGNNYLAAKINLAKDTLLTERVNKS
ncbi:MAG: molecular chaperone DnaJ [Neptuniibacter caesariensis]|uniref:Molecular chaperone DnaJ n=1 Tax=Neptuniibacter caesariensis TaxID=207954 RepID=A0A2G6JRG0_NEPCE|nr:MAG: molecular chaperone DnaJ [Neptuniibacter caesariensis]